MSTKKANEVYQIRLSKDDKELLRTAALAGGFKTISAYIRARLGLPSRRRGNGGDDVSGL